MKILNKDCFSEIHCSDARAYAGVLDCQKSLHERYNNENGEKERQVAATY